MGALMEFAIILGVTLAAELLHAFLPLPVPASIYGMILMLLLLMSGALKLDKVKRAGSFLLEIMPVMFIPAAVALMDSWSALQPILIPALVTIIVCNIVVMVVTGKTAEFIIKKDRKGENA